MKKNTFKKVGAILAGIALAFTMNAQGLPTAPWYAAGGANFVSYQNHFSLSKAELVKTLDLTQFEKQAKGYLHEFQFAEIDDADLIDGLYVTFLDKEASNLFSGKHETTDYDAVMNHEPMNTGTTFSFTDKDGTAGLGVYQGTNANTQVTFAINTRGLMNVTEIGIDMVAYGDKKFVNRSIEWNVSAMIYDLAAAQKTIYAATAPYFIAKNHTIGQHLTEPVLRTSDISGALKHGDLDNKYILITFESKLSEKDTDVVSEVGESAQTEALTVFYGGRVVANHPELAFGDPNEKVFSAGAGRSTICEDDILEVNVDFFNSIYANGTANIIGSGKPNNNYTATFNNVGRDYLWATDQAAAPKEELAYLEISVKYPFVLHKAQGNDPADFSKVFTGAQTVAEETGWYDVEDLVEWGIIGLDDSKADSLVYRIPREFLLQADKEDDHNRVSSIKFTYYFAPQEVAEFERADYIWATVSAEASETIAFELEGTSIPTFDLAGSVHFDKYLETKAGGKVYFENLPNFNKLGNNTVTHGGFSLRNTTRSSWVATERYDDDVVQIGWEITFTDEDDEEYEEYVTYVPGRVLAQKVSGISVIDWEKFLGELNNCFRCIDWDNLADAFVGVSVRDLEIITCQGNIADNILNISPVFHYHRGDVVIDDPASLYVQERYELNEGYLYKAGALGKDYSAATLINSEYYNGPLWVLGNNTFVYYTFSNEGILPNVLNLTKAFGEKARVDVFFAPYEPDNRDKQSRPHTVNIKVKDLKADEDGRYATIKVFKEQFYFGEAGDSKNYPVNGFMFSATEKEIANAGTEIFWKSSNTTKPVITPAVAGTYKGNAVTDTLYFRVDLNNSSVVKRLENEGLELEVIYKPETRTIGREIIADILKGCELVLPNVFDHIAQFGIVTADGKGFNEFYTVGTTDNGLASTLNWQTVIGTYNSFYNFILDKFNFIEGPFVSNIYQNLFKKTYDTEYLGTCYDNPYNTSGYIVAGINLIDPVDLTILTNTEDPAFIYTYIPVEGTTIVDDAKRGVKEIVPNQFGEILLMVTVEFAPESRDGLAMVSEKRSVNGLEIDFARYYANDTINLYPQKRTGIEANTPIFFNPNNRKEIVGINVEDWKFGIWTPFLTTGLTIADYEEAYIKGDVKMPKVYFSSDKEGLDEISLEAITPAVTVGEEGTYTFFVQGRDLPIDGVDAPEGSSKEMIEAVIDLFTGENGLITINGEEEIKIDVFAQSLALAKTIEFGNEYKFDGAQLIEEDLENEIEAQESDLQYNLVRGDIVYQVDVTLTPLADLCERKATVEMFAVCGEGEFAPVLELTYTPKLAKPVFAPAQTGDNGGSDFRVRWEPVAGAEYYQVAVGHWSGKRISENVFISEVYLNPATNELSVELFNGTGNVINLGIDPQYNYWLRITKSIAGKKDDVKDIDLNQIEDIQGALGYWAAVVTTDFVDEVTNDDQRVMYTIQLMDGLSQIDEDGKVIKNAQIDIYQFDNANTHMARKPNMDPQSEEYDMISNRGNFDDTQWSVLTGSLPKEAYFLWEDDFGFVALTTSAPLQPKVDKENSIVIRNLEIKSDYIVAVYAYDQCLKDEKGLIESVEYKEIFTSANVTSTGDIYFTEYEEWDSIDLVDGSSVNILGDYGYINIQGAAGKTVVVSDILGRQVANTFIESNDVRIAAPAGIVVVAIDGQAVKTVVK